jgi:hypothetical protein
MELLREMDIAYWPLEYLIDYARLEKERGDIPRAKELLSLFEENARSRGDLEWIKKLGEERDSLEACPITDENNNKSPSP